MKITKLAKAKVIVNALHFVLWIHERTVNQGDGLAKVLEEEES